MPGERNGAAYGIGASRTQNQPIQARSFGPMVKQTKPLPMPTIPNMGTGSPKQIGGGLGSPLSSGTGMVRPGMPMKGSPTGTVRPAPTGPMAMKGRPTGSLQPIQPMLPKPGLPGGPLGQGGMAAAPMLGSLARKKS